MNLLKYKIFTFTLIVVIIQLFSIQKTDAQSCVNSVSPGTLYFEYNPSYTNGV